MIPATHTWGIGPKMWVAGYNRRTTPRKTETMLALKMTRPDLAAEIDVRVLSLPLQRLEKPMREHPHVAPPLNVPTPNLHLTRHL